MLTLLMPVFFFSAAIVHYLDPTWRTAELKDWTEDLIRDVNNPVDNDPYFAHFRNWDWFAGHSWAGGIKVNGALDGRDQESVPEVKIDFCLPQYDFNLTT